MNNGFSSFHRHKKWRKCSAYTYTSMSHPHARYCIQPYRTICFLTKNDNREWNETEHCIRLLIFLPFWCIGIRPSPFIIHFQIQTLQDGRINKIERERETHWCIIKKKKHTDENLHRMFVNHLCTVSNHCTLNVDEHCNRYSHSVVFKIRFVFAFLQLKQENRLRSDYYGRGFYNDVPAAIERSNFKNH